VLLPLRADDNESAPNVAYAGDENVDAEPPATDEEAELIGAPGGALEVKALCPLTCLPREGKPGSCDDWASV
jgi:hypothetical protein